MNVTEFLFLVALLLFLFLGLRFLAPWVMHRWYSVRYNIAKKRLAKSDRDMRSLVEAAFTPEAKLQRAKERVQEWCAGEELPWKNHYIHDALEAGWSYTDMGITEEEAEAHLAGKNAKRLACEVLAKWRQCPNGHETSYFEYVFRENNLEPEDVGTSSAELVEEFEKFRRSPCQNKDHRFRPPSP